MLRNGTCKWFDDFKGYGFIRPDPDDDSPDAIVHHSVIVMPGRRTLGEGQRVLYRPHATSKGLVALDVEPLEPTPEPKLRAVRT